MAFNLRLVTGGQSSSGTLNTVVAGTITGGSTVTMAEVAPSTLSALYVVDAETTSLTMAPVWEVSNDGTTWNRLHNATATAPTVLATGTAGADATVTAAVTAPEGVYGWRFCRASILSAGATGTTSDTYTISYNYCRPAFN